MESHGKQQELGGADERRTARVPNTEILVELEFQTTEKLLSGGGTLPLNTEKFK